LSIGENKAKDMQMLRKRKKAPSAVRINIVYLFSQFACGRCGNEVEQEVEAVQGPGTRAILEEQEMDIRCPRCGWEGKPLGKDKNR
jgi:DNA-directed RNA polymerase subunit RPC12/RpoP